MTWTVPAAGPVAARHVGASRTRPRAVVRVVGTRRRHVPSAAAGAASSSSALLASDVRREASRRGSFRTILTARRLRLGGRERGTSPPACRATAPRDEEGEREKGKGTLASLDAVLLQGEDASEAPDVPPSKGVAEEPEKSEVRGGEGDDARSGLSALRLLDLDTVRQRWDVPWGGWRVFLGIGGWSLSFVLTAAVVVPLVCVVNGIDPRAFNPSEKSGYLLGIQALETGETFVILWLLLRKFVPALDDDWFNVDPRNDAFSIEKGWLTWGLIGYVMVFASIAATATAIDAGGHAWEAIQHAQQMGSHGGLEGVGGLSGGISEGAGSTVGVAAGAGGAGETGSAGSSSSAAAAQGPGTIDAVLPLLGGGDDQATRFLSILAVTSVLAPALEEVVFRGFLLASLTKWLPTPGAVLFSSVVFAGAHFAPRDFPQLVALGMVLGFSYARTRNLLTPMLIHSLWNSGVLVVVAVLVSTGNTDMLPGL